MFIPALVLGFIALIVGMLFKQTYSKVKKIKDTPTTDIRYLDEGYFEVKAAVTENSTFIQSPLSDLECVWFCIHIEEYIKRGKNGSWRTKIKLTEQGRCILDDGSGECLLDLKHIDFDFNTQYSGKSGTLDNPTSEEQAALQKFGIDGETFLGFNRKLRYTEYILRPNDELYILGNCEEQSGSDLMVLRGTSDQKLFVSDKSEDVLIKKHNMQLVWQGGLTLALLAGAAAFSVVAILDLVH